MATKDQVAQFTVLEAQKRRYNRDSTLAVLSTFYQESGWSETIWDPTHTTYGVAQQDGSYPNRMNGYKAQILGFFDRLDAQLRKSGASDSMWLNICWLQQAPNWPSADYWYQNGRRAYLTEIQSRIDTVTPYLDKYWPADTAPAPVPTPEEPPVADAKRPAFNEFPMWSPNYQDRGGDLPRIIALHTQEGNPVPPPDDAAERLGGFCQNNPVSYHLYISQASDGGVTVVDGVDSDDASWSVGNANDISINYCVAGSNSSWSRDEWMKYAGNAIDVAAWYAVQDIKKYPTIAAKVIGFGGNYPGSTASDSGVTDHEWVTEIFGWGDHTDVGPNFPEDYFRERFAFWLAGGEAQSPPPVEVPDPPVPTPADPRQAIAQAFLTWVMDDKTTELDLLRYLTLQIGTGHPAWPSAGRTIRDQVFYGPDPE
jgi:hypothetical protein